MKASATHICEVARAPCGGRARSGGHARLGRRSRSAGIRAAILAAVVALALVALLAPLPVSAGAVSSYSTQELAVFELINQYREDNGLARLLLSDTISDACTKHNLDMGKYGFTGHVTTLGSDYFPIGATHRDRMRICGYDYPLATVGEILGYGSAEPQAIFNAWKDSSGHNAIMLGSPYRVAGVSMDEVPGSQEIFYWGLDFGDFIDPSAHEPGGPSPSTTTTTTPPASTTTAPPATTTTTAPPATTTTTTVPPSTTTTTVPPSTTTTTVPPTTTTTTVPPAPQFTDVSPSYRFYREISTLAAASVISGYKDNSFRPDTQVTRAQFAKIIMLAIGRHTEPVDNLDHPAFPDVLYAGQSYPFDFVQEAAALGIVKGRGDGTFGPGDSLTRGQLALMLLRAGAAALEPVPADFAFPFRDVPAYLKEAVAAAYYNGLVSGKTAAGFDPYGLATRGQLAKMVYNLMERLRP